MYSQFCGIYACPYLIVNCMQFRSGGHVLKSIVFNYSRVGYSAGLAHVRCFM